MPTLKLATTHSTLAHLPTPCYTLGMSTTEPAPATPPKKRWSCCFIAALCMAIPGMAVVLLVGWIILIHRVIPKPALVISEETTYVTAPLTADGQIDFFKALEQKFYPPELATDDNGFRIFVCLFGDVGYEGKPEDREFYRLQKNEKLGLDPNVQPTLTLPMDPDKVIEEFYKAQGEEYLDDRFPIHIDFKATYSPEEITGLLKQREEQRNKDGKKYRERENNQWDRPWTLEEYPMLADWVNEIDAPLDAIADAVRKPIFFFPLLQSPESVQSGKPQNLLEVKPDQIARSVARLFQARATYRIAQGNIDDAIDDQLTLFRLGRLVPQTGMLIHHLVGISVEAVARGIPVGANPEHSLTEQQIRRILDGLNALPPRAPIYDAIEWERYMGLSTVQEVMRDASSLFGMDIHVTHRFATSFDWNIIFRRMNEMYDATQEPRPRKKYYAMMEELEMARSTPWNMFVWLVTPGSVESRIANMFLALLCPAVDAFEESIHRSECAENLQRLALAMMLYQHEHGKMPNENWAVQIEPYLTGTPAQEPGVPANNGVPVKYFSCPSNPSPEGMSTYAPVQYGDTNGEILLVELSEAVPLGEAVISVEEALARQRTGSLHSGEMNVAHRNGAVRFVLSP